MRVFITASILLFAALMAGCGETPDAEVRNIAAILSPDGSRIAFVRSFHYYVNKASVFDPSGWEEDVYSETSVYIIDKSTRSVTKLGKVSEDWYYCDRYNCPVNISWEDDLVAYSTRDAVYITDLDGNGRGVIDISTRKYGPVIPLTLSGDAQKLFYLGRHPWEHDREGLYSVRIDGSDKSFISDLGNLEYYDVYDMLWYSGQDSILIVEGLYQSGDPLIWQIDPEKGGLEESLDGLQEYRRRRLGGREAEPPFPELEELTKDITYAEWDVPPPDEFD